MEKENIFKKTLINAQIINYNLQNCFVEKLPISYDLKYSLSHTWNGLSCAKLADKLYIICRIIMTGWFGFVIKTVFLMKLT